MKRFQPGGASAVDKQRPSLTLWQGNRTRQRCSYSDRSRSPCSSSLAALNVGPRAPGSRLDLPASRTVEDDLKNDTQLGCSHECGWDHSLLVFFAKWLLSHCPRWVSPRPCQMWSGSGIACRIVPTIHPRRHIFEFGGLLSRSSPTGWAGFWPARP